MPLNVFGKDHDAVRCISNMESGLNADWRSFKEALTRRIYLLAVESCSMPSDTHSKWHQGRVQELSDLLNSFASARDTRTAVSAKPTKDGGF